MEVEEVSWHVRKEIHFLIATELLEGKWKGQKTHRLLLASECQHRQLGITYPDDRAMKRRCYTGSHGPCSTKKMWRTGAVRTQTAYLVSYLRSWAIVAKEMGRFISVVGKLSHAQAFYLQVSLSPLSTVPGTKLSWQAIFLSSCGSLIFSHCHMFASHLMLFKSFNLSNLKKNSTSFVSYISANKCLWLLHTKYSPNTKWKVKKKKKEKEKDQMYEWT